MLKSEADKRHRACFRSRRDRRHTNDSITSLRFYQRIQ